MILGCSTSIYAEAKTAIGAIELTIDSTAAAIRKSSCEARRCQLAQRDEYEDWKLDDFDQACDSSGWK